MAGVTCHMFTLTSHSYLSVFDSHPSCSALQCHHFRNDRKSSDFQIIVSDFFRISMFECLEISTVCLNTPTYRKPITVHHI